MIKRIIRDLRIALKSGKSILIFFRLEISSFFSRIFFYPSLSKALILGPRFVFLGITFNCNYKCLFCLEHSPLEFPIDSLYHLENEVRQKDYLSCQIDYALFKKIVDDIYDLGTRQVNFSGGGEALLHKDFMDICRYVKSKGLICSLSTNGEFLNEQISKNLIDQGVDSLNVSLNAASGDIHREINGLDRGAFENIIRNLSFLSSYKNKVNKIKPKVILSFVICKLNYSQIEKMVRIAIDLGIQEVGFWNFLYCKGRKSLVEHLLLDSNDILLLKHLLIETAILAKKNRIKTNIPSFLKKLQQGKGNEFLVQDKNLRICQIQADGLVYPYDFPYEMGNVNRQSLIEIWYSYKYINFRKNLLSLIKNRKTIPNYPFCRRCKAPFYNKELCTIQC